MTEREKIEILQKKAEIQEVVRKKMQLAYGQIRQEKRMHEEIEGQKNERGKTVVSPRSRRSAAHAHRSAREWPCTAGTCPCWRGWW